MVYKQSCNINPANLHLVVNLYNPFFTRNHGEIAFNNAMLLGKDRADEQQEQRRYAVDDLTLAFSFPYKMMFAFFQIETLIPLNRIYPRFLDLNILYSES